MGFELRSMVARMDTHISIQMFYQYDSIKYDFYADNKLCIYSEDAFYSDFICNKLGDR